MSACKAILVVVGIVVLCLVFQSITGNKGDAGVAFFLISVGTGIWAARDSKKIEFHKYKGIISNGPGVLFLGHIMLWVVVFPCYLVARGKILQGKSELKDKYRLDAAQHRVVS